MRIHKQGHRQLVFEGIADFAHAQEAGSFADMTDVSGAGMREVGGGNQWDTHSPCLNALASICFHCCFDFTRVSRMKRSI